MTVAAAGVHGAEPVGELFALRVRWCRRGGGMATGGAGLAGATSDVEITPERR